MFRQNDAKLEANGIHYAMELVESDIEIPTVEPEITNDDLDSVGYICNFLKYKKIPFNTFTINLKLSYSKLNDIITGNAKDIHVKSTFKTKLLNKKINLGKFKMDISEVIFLNFKEILETYNKNKKEQKDVDIQLIIRSMKPEENYLIFI